MAGAFAAWVGVTTLACTTRLHRLVYIYSPLVHRLLCTALLVLPLFARYDVQNMFWGDYLGVHFG